MMTNIDLAYKKYTVKVEQTEVEHVLIDWMLRTDWYVSAESKHEHQRIDKDNTNTKRKTDIQIIRFQATKKAKFVLLRNQGLPTQTKALSFFR